MNLKEAGGGKLALTLFLGLSIVSAQDRNPVVRHKPEAVYPRQALGICGVVTLSLDIDETGKTTNVRVVNELEPSLDAAAVRAAETWLFVPGMKAGKPAPFSVRTDMAFRRPGCVWQATPPDDPAKWRFMVRCMQGQTNPNGTVGRWLGASSPILFSWGQRERHPNESEIFTGDRSVFGVLANNIDLSQDEVTAKKILDSAVRFAQQKCQCGTEDHVDTPVEIRHGDPATFTEDKFTGVRGGIGTPDQILESFRKSYPVIALKGQSSSTRPGDPIAWDTSGAWGRSNYHNHDRERRVAVEEAKLREQQVAQQMAQAAEAARLQKVRQAEVTRQQNAQAAVQANAQQQRIAALHARSAAFVAAYGVKHFVTLSQLAANPFVYQGQVVALYVTFHQMNSATEGLFARDFNAILVSSIPAARFTQQNAMVMLAGRVVDKKEVKLPILGPTSVPHLDFVGSAFCREQQCADYAIVPK